MAQPEIPTSGTAIGSLICGILSIPAFCVWPVSLLLALTSIILGVLALSTIRQGKASGRGLAIGGIACSAVALLLAVALIAAVTIWGPEIANKFKQATSEIEQQQKAEALRRAQNQPVNGPEEPTPAPDDQQGEGD